MGLGNSEVSQEQTHGLAPHRAATVRVKGELVGFNVLLATALGDEALGERGTFSVSQHPANHVAGEDVEDDVEVVVGPLDGATKLRDIPRPNLVRRFGQQLRLGVVRMAPLVPALSDLAVLLQNPIHRANRAEVGSLVQKRSPHLSGRLVDEPLTVQGPEDFLALSFVESSVRPRDDASVWASPAGACDTTWNEPHPEPRRLPPFAQSAPPAPRPPRSVVLVALEWIQGDPQ